MSLSFCVQSRHALTRHGYIVIPAPDGPSALCACREKEGPVHLALLDITMPNMSGPELFDRLLAVYPKIAVLFMSGYRPAQIADLAPKASTVHFIAKPFLPRDLVKKVNAILDNDDVCSLLDDELECVPSGN